MGGRSKRNRRGGDKIEEVQSQLDSIQKQLNELKDSSSSSSMTEESVVESTSEPEVKEESVKVDKTWVDDKNKKFRDGDGGRVSLSFNRMMTLLDSNIKKGDTTKEWSSIKEKLVDANSLDEVQDVIDKYKMSFASNYIAGTRRRKRHGKKRTHRRR
jgi:uncharacterized membrane protein YukC